MLTEVEKPHAAGTTSKVEDAEKAALAESLVDESYESLYRLALSILDDPGEADDAAQETILRALAGWVDGLSQEGRRAWLARIAINHCRDRLRRQRTRQAVVGVLQALHLAGAEASVEEQAERRQSRSELWGAVRALDEKHRLPVVLRFVHGMTAAEIAEALHIREGTVYSRLHHALRQLRAQVQKPGADGPGLEPGGEQG